MKFALLCLISFSSFAAWYDFEPGEEFFIPESRWVRMGTMSGERLDHSCQLLSISRIKVVEQFDESVIYEVQSNRDKKSPGCKKGDLIHTNDVLGDTLRDYSNLYSGRKAQLAKILEGEHALTTLNGLYIGDAFSVIGWSWAKIEQDFIYEDETFHESNLCRILDRGFVQVVGFIIDNKKEMVLLRYNLNAKPGYSECPNGILFTEPAEIFGN